MGWNSTPPDSGIFPAFGITPEELRGPYLAEALARQQREWPWVGVTATWFFKQANDEEATQPQYYFRLVNPDFSPLPAWDALRDYIHAVSPMLYRGYHQEDHWVLREGLSDPDAWALVQEPSAVFGHLALGQAGERLRVTVEGERLTLVVQPGRAGTLLVSVGGAERRFHLDETAARDDAGERVGTITEDAGATVLHLPLGSLPDGRTEIVLTVEQGSVALDGVIVE